MAGFMRLGGKFIRVAGAFIRNCVVACCDFAEECQACYPGAGSAPATITGTFNIPDPQAGGGAAGLCEPWYTYYDGLTTELDKYTPEYSSPYCCYYRGPTGAFTGTYITLELCRSSGLDPVYKANGALWTDSSYSTPAQNPLGEDIVFAGEFGVGQVDCDNFTVRTGDPFTGEGLIDCNDPFGFYYGVMDFVVGAG